MKVILKKDVAKVGQKGAVVEVKKGYAQNFLIARGLAEIATPAKIAQAQREQEARAQEVSQAHQKLQEGLAKLDGGTLTIRATANEKKHLFEAVSADVIAGHIRDVISVDVGSDAISVDEPIKTLGKHTAYILVNNERVPVALSIEPK